MAEQITQGVMHLAEALSRAGVLTDRVEVSLDRRDWWDLLCALDRELGGINRYDGRGPITDAFSLCGVRFRRRD